MPPELKLLYTASSAAEAEMLSQVLIENGFHIEFVPTEAAGIFGITGNPSIYVQEGEYEQAIQFIGEYFNNLS